MSRIAGRCRYADGVFTVFDGGDTTTADNEGSRSRQRHSLLDLPGPVSERMLSAAPQVFVPLALAATGSPATQADRVRADVSQFGRARHLRAEADQGRRVAALLDRFARMSARQRYTLVRAAVLETDAQFRDQPAPSRAGGAGPARGDGLLDQLEQTLAAADVSSAPLTTS